MNITLTDNYDNMSMDTAEDARHASGRAWDYITRHNVETVTARKTDGTFLCTVTCIIDGPQ